MSEGNVSHYNEKVFAPSNSLNLHSTLMEQKVLYDHLHRVQCKTTKRLLTPSLRLS